MRVVVTGGAGFIGHNIVLYLYEKGFDIIVIDNFESFLLGVRGRGLRKLVLGSLELMLGIFRVLLILLEILILLFM